MGNIRKGDRTWGTPNSGKQIGVVEGQEVGGWGWLGGRHWGRHLMGWALGVILYVGKLNTIKTINLLLKFKKLWKWNFFSSPIYVPKTWESTALWTLWHEPQITLGWRGDMGLTPAFLLKDTDAWMASAHRWVTHCHIWLWRRIFFQNHRCHREGLPLSLKRKEFPETGDYMWYFSNTSCFQINRPFNVRHHNNRTLGKNI